MSRFSAYLCLVLLLATPLRAEEPREGLSLMERGAQLFLEGILKEMEPTLEDLEGLGEDIGPALRNFAQQMGPKMMALLDEIEDWSAYEAPEVLPNGDIIIRRKPVPPEEAPSTPEVPEAEMPQIDL